MCGAGPKASVLGDRDDKSPRKQQKAPGRGEETWGLQDKWVLGTQKEYLSCCVPAGAVGEWSEHDCSIVA